MTDHDAPPDSGLLDEEQLSQFTDIAFDDFKEILDEMIAEVPRLLTENRLALEAGDQAAGRRAAHKLRGMVLNFGCTAFAAKLWEIERSNPFPGGEPARIAAELDSLWQVTRAALDRWAGSLGSPGQ